MVLYIQKHLIVYVINNYLNINIYKTLAYQNTILKKFKLKNFNIFFLKRNNLYKFTLFKNYQLFNSYYLKNIYKVNLKERNFNAINILPKKLSKQILFKTRKINYKKFNIKYFNEIVYLFLVNIWVKNSKNICKYIKKKLECVHFKKHKGYFLFFFKIINKYVSSNFNLLKLKGIALVFRGKLSKGGNSRKKVLALKRGYFSLSNKLLSLNVNKWDVWTKTGTFGCSLQLFYINMTLFLNFYMLIYILTLIQIQFFLNMHNLNIGTTGITYLFYYISKFSKFKNVILLFTLSLTAIPPFLVFYIKFNFLINLTYKSIFLNIILIYLVLFLHMLFYMQIFFFKNINYNINILKPKQYSANFYFIFYSIYFLSFIMFGFFFFSDMFFMVKLLYVL